jgi:hypothetical protein
MARPKGLPKTGGRKKGQTNLVTRDIKALAGDYGPAALTRIAELAGLVSGKAKAESEQAQMGALKEIMDRAYGKPKQETDLNVDLTAKVQAIVSDKPLTIDEWQSQHES